MRRVCLALATLGLLADAAGAAAECQSATPPEVLVQTQAPKVSHDQAMTRDQIFAFVRRTDPAGGKGYDGVLGITETDMGRNARSELKVEHNPEGGVCVSLATIEVDLSWKITVHVASELRRGSCMYGVVSTHEQGHVDIDLKAMGYSQALIKKELQAFPSQSVAAATPDEGAEVLQRALGAKLDAIFAKLDAEVKRRQNAHDTPEEYRKGAKQCGAVENNRALGS